MLVRNTNAADEKTKLLDFRTTTSQVSSLFFHENEHGLAQYCRFSPFTYTEFIVYNK